MGGRYNYYHCGNKSCKEFGKSIKKLELEKEFFAYLARITPKEAFLKTLKETAIDMWRSKGHRFELEVEKWNKKMEMLEAKKKRIYEMREDGSYTKEEFVERKDEVENEMAATRISSNEARIEQFDLEGTVIYATNFIADLGRQWFDLVPHLQPKFQKLVFPEGIPYVRGKGFGTAKLGLIYELNQHSADQNYHLVESEEWNQSHVERLVEQIGTPKKWSTDIHNVANAVVNTCDPQTVNRWVMRLLRWLNRSEVEYDLVAQAIDGRVECSFKDGHGNGRKLCVIETFSEMAANIAMKSEHGAADVVLVRNPQSKHVYIALSRAMVQAGQNLDNTIGTIRMVELMKINQRFRFAWSDMATCGLLKGLNHLYYFRNASMLINPSDQLPCTLATDLLVKIIRFSFDGRRFGTMRASVRDETSSQLKLEENKVEIVKDAMATLEDSLDMCVGA
jgi:hypothetical protein